MQRRSVISSIAALVAMLTIAVTGIAIGSTGAGAQSGEFRRGPDPTDAALRAAAGPFATAQISVPASVAGFGGGTITYPTATNQGTFGAFVFAPGYTASSANYTWVGPRVASHGFVVLTFNTNSRFDFPSSRATQAQNALDFLVNSSSVANRIDRNRLAVSGHSMGGGGTLIAADNNANLQAAVPLMPWNTSTNFSGVNVPSMIVGAQNDSVAPVNQHAIPFYNSIPAASEKAYLELAGQGHNVATTANTTQQKFLIVWMKRYVDNDTRYEQFICPPPATSSAISQYRNTCPG
jgi:dienelactone hydrolase